MIDFRARLCYNARMELRELKYFLAVAREESITRAAEYLHITQPCLTRQIQSMEAEVGQPLFLRTGRKMLLTDAGRLLRKRAEEITELYDKAEREWLDLTDGAHGEVYIGGGESYGMTFLADAALDLLRDYPEVKIHIYSGDIIDVTERLDKGLIDFGLLMQPPDITKYESLSLPYRDRWGLLLRSDHPLAQKEFIAPEDLSGLPVMQSRQSLQKSRLNEWLNGVPVNVIGSYNLLYNATYFALNGAGGVLCLDKLINTTGGALVFRPLRPTVEAEIKVVWKKYRELSKAAQIFLKLLTRRLSAPQRGARS